MTLANKIDNDITDYVYEKDSWLYWKKLCSYACKQKIGSLAGCLNKSTGYYVVMINGKTYMNHRILYQLYHNIILGPDDVIDHVNRIRTDNRKENLVKKTNQENCCNRNTNKNNTSGLKNIRILHRDGYDDYYIRIKVNYKVAFSKCYRTDRFTEQEVIEIRNKKLLELHGDSASFG